MMLRTSRVRALTLIEIIIGLVLIALAGAVLLTNLTSNSKLAGMTRNRTAAALIARNFAEDVKAHNYGEPAPKNWPTVTTETVPPDGWNGKYDPDDPNYERIPMLVYGRPARLVFYRQLRLQNGSFLDKNIKKKTDKVTLQVWWREKNNAKEEFKSLEIEMGVRNPW